MGNEGSASDEEFIQKNNIGLIINCSKEIKNYFESNENINYLRCAIYDSGDSRIEQYFKATFIAIQRVLTKTDKSVLIHCKAGVSRSPTITIAYFMRLNKWSFNKAFSFVFQKRKQIDPNMGFIVKLREYEKLIKSN